MLQLNLSLVSTFIAKRASCVRRAVVYPNTISADEMSKGFIQLLKCADDLALDVPEAGQLLGGCALETPLPTCAGLLSVSSVECTL
jgi:hypothetical protein